MNGLYSKYFRTPGGQSVGPSGRSSESEEELPPPFPFLLFFDILFDPYYLYYFFEFLGFFDLVAL
jgi:hypothetical protein